MEKPVLKTLRYADSFGYPLTLAEIHKWLIGKKATPRALRKTLDLLIKRGKVKEKDDFFFLSKRDDPIAKRLVKQKKSVLLIMKLIILTNLLKLFPWIKLVGISGEDLLVISDGQKSLAKNRKNIEQAHEVLGMKVVWQRDNVYQKYLEENSWAIKYLPNWVSKT